MFDWARYRRSKGAVKLHLLLDRQGCLPRWAKVTDGKRADVKVAWTLDPRPGSVVAMDRGYNDYALFAKWHERGAYFVTRMKDNAQYEVVEERPVPERAAAESDETIVLTEAAARKACPHELRRVVVWDEKKERELAFLTNSFDLAAATIGKIYHERWQIELFYKTLKQNLRVKTFLGTTENAVQTQLWTALIAMLLMKLLQMRSQRAWCLSHLIAVFRVCMFAHKDLQKWLNDPGARKPPKPRWPTVCFRASDLDSRRGSGGKWGAKRVVSKEGAGFGKSDNWAANMGFYRDLEGCISGRDLFWTVVMAYITMDVNLS